MSPFVYKGHENPERVRENSSERDKPQDDGQSRRKKQKPGLRARIVADLQFHFVPTPEVDLSLSDSHAIILRPIDGR